MNKIILLGIGLVIIIGGFIFILSRDELDVGERFNQEDKILEETENAADSDASGSDSMADIIRIESPQSEDVVQNPIEVSGMARGYWFFEATAPVQVTDWDGRIIGEGYIEADGDWMTTEFVPFHGEIQYSADPDVYSNRGTVIFQKSNPSALPENDVAIKIMVELK